MIWAVVQIGNDNSDENWIVTSESLAEALHASEEWGNVTVLLVNDISDLFETGF
jgi:hypothetical protein